jgi:predicted dinucleotide-binding enzyme
MCTGIPGSGLMGGKLGMIFAKAGHEVIFSYSRSERKLKRLAREAEEHARPGTPRDAALDAAAVLLAVHWSRVDDVLKQAGEPGHVMVEPITGQLSRRMLEHYSHIRPKAKKAAPDRLDGSTKGTSIKRAK